MGRTRPWKPARQQIHQSKRRSSDVAARMSYLPSKRAANEKAYINFKTEGGTSARACPLHPSAPEISSQLELAGPREIDSGFEACSELGPSHPRRGGIIRTASASVNR